MFEKESQDYAARETAPRQELYIKGRADINADYEDVKRIWREGAEFGYSKANEWHYPSKGELPQECENVWCYCKGTGFKFCCAGHTIVGGDNEVRWWANNKHEELRVIAWKEIILPKESE